jgi:hypothetical protein
LAKEDKAKALRVLREAAAVAKRMSLPSDQPGAGFPGRAVDLSGSYRVMELIGVAAAAAELGFRAEACAWLAEAEAMIGQLHEIQRGQSFGHLASAWALLDQARAEKMLAAVGPDPFQWDLAVSKVLERLRRGDPEKAVPWLDRFKRIDFFADVHRSHVAARLADRDLARAVRLAEGIRGPNYRGLTLARLATVAHKADPPLAHVLIEKAAAAVADPNRKENEGEQRLGVAVYLLWQAKAVKYPDLASVVAVALTSRSPVPTDAHAAETWWSQTVLLAAGVGSVDPAAGRALLGPDPDRDLADPRYVEEYSHAWITALALVDPTAAARNLAGRDRHDAADVLAVLKRRAAVIERLELLHGLHGPIP